MKKPVSNSLVMLMGPVTSITSLKTARTGQLVFRFQVATHEVSGAGKVRSCFHTVAVWGDYAATAARIVEPRRRVQVIGRLTSYQYGKGPRYVEVRSTTPIQLLHRDLDMGPEDEAPEIAWADEEYAEFEPVLLPESKDEDE